MKRLKFVAAANNFIQYRV